MKFVIKKMYQASDKETVIFLSSYCTGADGKDMAIFSNTMLGFYKDADVADKCVKDLERVLKASDGNNEVIIDETIDAPNKDVDSENEPDEMGRIFFG